MRHALRAFRHRNFRLFYVGQAISLIGTWIHQIALAWLVYRTTGSGFLLGWSLSVIRFPCLSSCRSRDCSATAAIGAGF